MSEEGYRGGERECGRETETVRETERKRAKGARERGGGKNLNLA